LKIPRGAFEPKINCNEIVDEREKEKKFKTKNWHFFA
jgi:hypothetical protein